MSKEDDALRKIREGIKKGRGPKELAKQDKIDREQREIDRKAQQKIRKPKKR